MPDITITDEMVELFARNRAKAAIDPTQVDAYVDGLRNSQGWANVRAGLEAVAPLLRAQWEAERAESVSVGLEGAGHPSPPETAGSWPSVEHSGPRHVYLSTGCLHGEHDYCASMTGAQGQKRPATCKFCDAKCVCDCHKENPS